jgi:hypothetical protein
MENTGIDVHKRESQLCIITEQGEVVEQRIRTERGRFAEVLGTRLAATASTVGGRRGAGRSSGAAPSRAPAALRTRGTSCAPCTRRPPASTPRTRRTSRARSPGVGRRTAGTAAPRRASAAVASVAPPPWASPRALPGATRPPPADAAGIPSMQPPLLLQPTRHPRHARSARLLWQRWSRPSADTPHALASTGGGRVRAAAGARARRS